MYEDHYARLDNTKPVDAKDPFIGEGQHTLLVLNIEEYGHQEKGPTAKATFEVLESAVHPRGSRVCKMWFLTKPSKFPNQANDSDRFADFVRNLKGAPQGHPIGQDCRALLRDRAAEQLARGMVIRALGINTSKKADKPFVDVRWTNVQQAPEQIAQMRAQAEQSLAANPLRVYQGQRPQQVHAPYYPPPAQPQYAAPPPAAYTPPPPVAGPPAQPPAQPGYGGYLAALPPQNNGGQGGGNNGAPPAW
jgi:hypothetical protein